MPREKRQYFKRLVGLAAHVKWDWIPLLMIIPLLAQRLNLLLGRDPIFRRLGAYSEPAIEMALLGAIGVYITLRAAQRIKRAEELRRAEERYRAIVEDQTELICRFSPNGTLTFVNEAYCRFFGEQREQLIGKRFTIFLPDTDQAEFKKGLASLSLENPVLTLEHRAVSPQGELRWLRCTSRAIFDAGGTLVEFQSVGRDMTDRKWAQMERERLIEELRAKNADLELFNRTVSHDLKSPLITVKGLLSWVERDAVAGNADRLKSNLQLISNAAGRMEQLIDQLSQIMRMGHQGESWEELPFEHLAHSAVELLAGRIADGHVEVEIASDLPTVRGNRSTLLQVLQNLIENAVKFMGNQPHPRVEIGARQEGRDTVFYVRDNGIGIDPCCQEKVFDVFDRVDHSVEGCGLGLSLVKRGVEAHGGRIWVESEGLGQGCTFCFSLRVSTPSDTDRQYRVSADGPTEQPRSFHCSLCPPGHGCWYECGG